MEEYCKIILSGCSSSRSYGLLEKSIPRTTIPLLMNDYPQYLGPELWSSTGLRYTMEDSIFNRTASCHRLRNSPAENQSILMRDIRIQEPQIQDQLSNATPSICQFLRGSKTEAQAKRSRASSQYSSLCRCLRLWSQPQSDDKPLSYRIPAPYLVEIPIVRASVLKSSSSGRNLHTRNI